MARTATIPFFNLGTIVGQGAGLPVRSDTFDLAGITRLVVDFRKYGESGGPGTSNLAASIEFSQDNVTYDESAALTVDSITPLFSEVMLRYARVAVECDLNESVTFKIIARAMDAA